MALMKEQIDLLLKMQTKEFFSANKKVIKEYQKTKGKIEKKPIHFKETGTANMLKRLASIGIAYMGIRKVITDLSSSQTNLANIATLGVKNIEELGEGIRQIGMDVPVALHDIEKGMYDVVSAGVAASDQIKVLELSAKAAKAGLSETNEALSLGSAVIKGYGKDWSEFEKVMDQAFKTVELGQTTFPELSANLGKVIPLAANLKVGTEELFGAFATLTGVTGNTAEVATQLRGIFAATIKPTAELTELFKDYGGASAALQELGLAEYLKVIASETEGNSEKMGKLIPRVEGLNAVLSLSGTQFDNFVKKTGAMKDSTGAMGDAFGKQADTLESKLIKLDNSFQVLSQSVLTMFVPAITNIMDAGGDLLQWFAGLDEGTKKAVLVFGAFALAAWKVPPAMKAIQLSIKGLQISMGPAGWLLLGLGAIVTTFIAFNSEGKKAIETLETFEKELDTLTTKQLEAKLERIIAARAKFLEEEMGIVEQTLEGIEIRDISSEFTTVLPDVTDINKKLDPVTERLLVFNHDIEALQNSLKKMNEIKDVPVDDKTPEGKGIGGLKLAPADTSGIDRLDAENKKKMEMIEFLYDFETGFSAMTYQDLEAQYVFRSDMISKNLALIIDTYGIESKEYQRMMDAKLLVDKSYQGAKRTLEIQGAQASVQLLSQFMSAFQGQSETLFNIGKMASLANAAINTYEGATKALSAYPPPFNAIAAAATIALGLAQIAKISSTTFTPAGKKEGGEITAADLAFTGKKEGGKISFSDVMPSVFTPPGEDGLIGVQVRETIMNRGATDLFSRELARMNEIGRGRAQYPTIPAYAEGGMVTDVASVSSSLDPAVFAAVIENGIKKGFDRSKLRIEGQFKAKGQDLESAIDKREDLTSEA